MGEIKIVAARPKDLKALSAIAVLEGLDPVKDAKGVHVAWKGSRVVGYIRVVHGEDGVRHVNPVAVVRQERGNGIGSKLISFALSRYGELRLVSRGYCRGFYEKLGFERISWGCICEQVAQECKQCPMQSVCLPMPFGKVARSKGKAESEEERFL